MARHADISQMRYQKETLHEKPMAVMRVKRGPHFAPMNPKQADMLEDKTQRARMSHTTPLHALSHPPTASIIACSIMEL